VTDNNNNFRGQGRDNGYRDRQNDRDRPKRRQFEARASIMMEFDLADALGRYILDTNCDNPALVTLARQLTGDYETGCRGDSVGRKPGR